MRGIRECICACICALQVTNSLLQEIMDLDFLSESGTVRDHKKFMGSATKLKTKLLYSQFKYDTSLQLMHCHGLPWPRLMRTASPVLEMKHVNVLVIVCVNVNLNMA